MKSSPGLVRVNRLELFFQIVGQDGRDCVAPRMQPLDRDEGRFQAVDSRLEKSDFVERIHAVCDRFRAQKQSPMAIRKAILVEQPETNAATFSAVET